eukprot:m.54198 g.54198  ORF g.54198 m.54198 type:complete len:75 (-) comp21875_c0_seq1:158-382(-)
MAEVSAVSRGESPGAQVTDLRDNETDAVGVGAERKATATRIAAKEVDNPVRFESIMIEAKNGSTWMDGEEGWSL